MTFDARTFSDVIQRRLDELGAKPFAIENAHGLKKDALRNALRKREGNAGPSLARASEICEVLGLEFYIGPRRDQSLFVQQDDEAAERFFREQAANADFPLLPTLTKEGDYGVSADLKVSREFLEARDLRADELRVVEVPDGQGDVRLPKGSLAIVHCAPEYEPNGSHCAYFRPLMDGLQISRLHQVDRAKLARPIPGEDDLEFFQRTTGFEMIGPVLFVFQKMTRIAKGNEDIR